ncbi:MAG: selenocysteine-specific translation elongation factor, partial [Actinomycetota bacterium]|nr:selenocysteine-specific translation elongation factor [Actinomycetota bacterium]
MRVLATAGHVDHGKSTLVRALTGMEPDRWAEERRRGMTIDLGFAWTRLATGESVAFVDVPGHQRFVANMLAGVGPVPAMLLVIAADQGWCRQTSEHLDAIDALRIEHGLLAVTRADLASAEQVAAVIADARSRLASSSLGNVEALAVSGTTGQGIGELRDGIERLVAGMPAPVTDGRVRLWVDRAFTVKGAGTVVTGTLGAGRLDIGDELSLNGKPFTVRGLQALGDPADWVEAVARVAVNLRGLDRDQIGRGDCLLSPDAWLLNDRWDVRLDPMLAEPAGDLVLHFGSASIPVRARLLGGEYARLSLARPVPAEIGDRAVLRDPGQQSVVGGVLVLDPDPPALTRRGAAADRAVELASPASTGLPAQV